MGMRQTLSLLAIISVLCSSSLPVKVYAQEFSTASATVASSSAGGETPLEEVTIDSTSSANFISESSSSATTLEIEPTITESPTPADSGLIRRPMQVRQLAKRVYKASEKVRIDIDNYDAETAVTVTGPRGTSNGVYSYRQLSGSVTGIVYVPGNSFTPGKYTVQVEQSGTTVSQQDFYWGVLALNMNKTIVKPEETVQFSIGVLNDLGNMVCDADVRLEITDPTGQVTELSTGAGTIQVTPSCWSKEVTVIPDYAAQHVVAGVGTYNLNLSATTINGTYAVTDRFEVRDFVPFDVERVSATRIYPPNFYPMTMRIVANTDFTGDITETVPVSYTVREDESVRGYDSVAIDTPSVDESAFFVRLRYPFDGMYSDSLEFGEALIDPALQEQYQYFGLVGHDGIDFALPEGTPVLAADDGTVVLAGEGAYGTTVVVEHSWGRSYYGHLSSVDVQVGDQVLSGDVLGLSGHTGLTTGSHLHFGMKLKNPDMANGYYGKVDPSPYLNGVTTISESSVKRMTWHVSMKKGDEVSIGYQFQAPNISPQFYLLGPLTFRRSTGGEVIVVPEASGSAQNPYILGDATPSAMFDVNGTSATPSARVLSDSSVLFSESRQWQIAADATGTLYADSDIATTDWIIGTCTSNLWDCINEGTVSPNDSDYLKTSKGTGTFSYTHTATNSPSDVQTVTQIDFSVRAYYTVQVSTITVYYSTDGSDPSIQVGSPISLNVNTPTTQTVSATSLSLTKTQIDALRVKFVATVGKNAYVWVQASQYDITYDPTPSGPTNDQLLRHGAWFSSGVEQPFTF